jgi:hypothetical protein
MLNQLIDKSIGLGKCGITLANQIKKKFNIEVMPADLSKSLFDKKEKNESKFRHIFNFSGTGRNPEKGEEIVKKRLDDLELSLKDYVGDKEYILMVVGAGGGSGSGFFYPILDFLIKDKKQI